MNDHPNNHPSPRRELARRPRMKVAGIGGCGCAVLRLLARSWPAEDLLAVHSDSQVLAGTELPCQLQLGPATCHGQSTGGDVSLGRRAAEEEAVLFREWADGCDVLFMVLGLGGGTGSGAGPVLARVARDTGAAVLCFASLPFSFEGTERARRASKGLAALRDEADTVMILPCDRLPLEQEDGTALAMPSALALAGEKMAQWTRVMRALLMEEGIMNIDMGDVRSLLAQSDGVMAYAEAEGLARAERITDELFDNPLLEEGRVLAACGGVLVGLAGGPDLTLLETRAIMDRITGALSSGASASMGVTIKENWAGRLAVTLLAAGKRQAQPSQPESATRKKGAAQDASAKAARREQIPLSLDFSGRGRFKNAEPSIYAGEDLDTPTFIRRGIRLAP